MKGQKYKKNNAFEILLLCPNPKPQPTMRMGSHFRIWLPKHLFLCYQETSCTFCLKGVKVLKQRAMKYVLQTIKACGGKHCFPCLIHMEKNK